MNRLFYTRIRKFKRGKGIELIYWHREWSQFKIVRLAK